MRVTLFSGVKLQKVSAGLGFLMPTVEGTPKDFVAHVQTKPICSAFGGRQNRFASCTEGNPVA